MWKRILLGVPLALVAIGLLGFLLLPWPIGLRLGRNPELTSFMKHRLEQAERRGEPLEIRYRWVPLARISPHLRRAVVVAEDARFYDHHGVDWAALGEELRYRGDGEFSWFDPSDLRSLADALGYYLRHRDEVRGRSTITQQLAKNLYFGPERSLVRKAAEFLVAKRLEWFLEKDRILELYLNVAEFGPGVFGAEAAARHYFDTSAARLTRQQAAALAATLPHPLTSNPRLRPGRMEWRKSMILARMGATGPVRTVPLEPPAIEEPDVLSPVEIDEPRIELPPELVPDPPATTEPPPAPVPDSATARDPAAPAAPDSSAAGADAALPGGPAHLHAPAARPAP